MKHGVFIQLFAIVVFLVFLCGGATAGGGETLHSKGEVLYDKHCSSCHGIAAKGTDKGPPLIHRVYNPKHHADMSFHFAVERGVKAHHWRFGNMPRIEGVDKDEVDGIIVYIRGLQKEAGIF